MSLNFIRISPSCDIFVTRIVHYGNKVIVLYRVVNMTRLSVILSKMSQDYVYFTCSELLFCNDFVTFFGMIFYKGVLCAIFH